MACRFCNWLSKLLSLPGGCCDQFWPQLYRWEYDYADSWEPWDDDEARRQRASAAAKLVKVDPVAGLQEIRELSDLGSAWSMRFAGFLYGGAYGIERDDAMSEDYYRRALCAGSWVATIRYANLLYERGAHDKWPSTLADGVRQGFIPSFYWQAFNHYWLSPTRKTAQEMRPLLEQAAEAGHPGAKLLLGQLAARGKFGLGQLWRGFRMVHQAARDCATWSVEAEKKRRAENANE